MNRTLSTPAERAGAACISLLAIAPADRLVFEPEARSEVERTYTWTSSMDPEEVSVTLNGEPASDVPSVRAAVERSFQVVVTDGFVRSRTNQPLELVRTFEDVSGELEGRIVLETADGDLELDVEGDRSSPLNTIGVRFLWDADDEAYEVTYADDLAADEALLEGLEPDGHFIGLLPEDGDDVGVGAEWEIEPARLAAALRPFDDLPLETETTLAAMEGVLDPLLLPGPFELFAGEAAGDVAATLTEEEDGIATIEIVVDITVASDQAERVRPLVADALPDGVVARLRSADYDIAIDGVATLRWDVAAHRMVDFEFEADAGVGVELDFAVEIGGQAGSFALEESRAGEIAFRVK